MKREKEDFFEKTSKLWPPLGLFLSGDFTPVYLVDQRANGLCGGRKVSTPKRDYLGLSTCYEW